VDLDHIFTFHPPVGDQIDRYSKLRPAFKAYAEALLMDRVMNEDGELTLELAYEDIVRVVTELTPSESPEVDQAFHYINRAYDLAIDPDRAIVQAVQAAAMFANASVALEK
jgi:hypothetical protein